MQLEQIQIGTPCPADWNGMSGDAAQRFCPHCQKHVHRLSAMSRSAADELICNAGGSACVILEYTAVGQVITLDYAAPKTSRWRRWTPMILIAAALTTSLAAMGLKRAKATPAAPAKLMVMGDMVAQRPVSKPPKPTAAVRPTGSSPTTRGHHE